MRASPADAEQAAVTWRALAPLLAGRDRVRISRDGGRSYHRRWERTLTDALPQQPAAVPLYTAGGESRVLVVDLDSSRGGIAAVQRDVDIITALVDRCGGRLIRDHSPNGGVHLYIPLATPISFHAARDLAVALATRVATMDPTPNHNLTDGLIRPPGARHRTGGFQILDGSLATAHQLAKVGNHPRVFTALQRELADELAHLSQLLTDAHHSSDPVHCPNDQTNRQLTHRYAEIARTGQYDPGRYETPSEARQAVITSAAAAGYTATDIQRRVSNGTWPGLAALYARYKPGARAGAVARDHRKAVTWLNRNPPDQSNGAYLVHKSHTSEHYSHRAPTPPPNPSAELNEYQWIRRWENAVRSAELSRYPGRAGYGVRFLLRAMGEAARKRGTRHIDFGVRSLAIATGLDHGTVARYLSQLRKEPQPFVRLTRDHHALEADQYQLVIPDAELERSERQPWTAGKTHALRPVFRELGHVAALVYETIERSPAPLGVAELIDHTHISRAGIHSAVETLAAFNLITRRDSNSGWTRNVATSLADLAERFGCTDVVHRQMTRYSAERAIWRALVLSGPYLRAETFTDSPSWLPWPDPPPDDNYSLLDLLPSR
jgi:hypothetical protein